MVDETPQPVTATVAPSSDASSAATRFLDELADWAEACIADYRDEPPAKGHDQLTYTTSWLPLIRARQHEQALDFMIEQRDRVHAAHREAARWFHGYWCEQEAHHGTEHFEIFLATLWRVGLSEKVNEVTGRDMLNATEHLGNWAKGVPAWFNFDTGLFHSMYFGTRNVGRHDEGMDDDGVNVPDHFRCLNLALIGHRMTGEPRYLDLARAHGRRWAEAITQCESIPQAVGPDGAIETMNSASTDAYRSFAGQASDLSRRVDRAENLLCSDATTALLRLWQLTGELVMREAAERVLDELATQLDDPDAGPAADALRRYRRMTGDTRYDDAVRNRVASLAPFDVERITLEPQVKRKGGRPSGIGKRGDMPLWRENDEPVRHNPVLLAVAAEIDSDDKLMRCALDLARTRFALARRVYPHGRHHGCTARSVSAIARGHGRDNHAGMVTAVLGAYLEPTALPDGSPAAA